MNSEKLIDRVIQNERSGRIQWYESRKAFLWSKLFRESLDKGTLIQVFIRGAGIMNKPSDFSEVGVFEECKDGILYLGCDEHTALLDIEDILYVAVK